MYKILSNFLLVSPALFVFGLFSTPVYAQTEEITASEEDNLVLPQVTSVSQLSDVQPTDWAFQALQNLVERYNCIAGYPDGTFRGNRAMTRYEFAAGLNACLERITEVLGTQPNNLATQEDLVTLQRLMEEFPKELALLRGRVDGLEVRTRQLEENQFSTTTKLTGLAVFNLTGARARYNLKAEGIDAFTAARDPLTNQPVVRTISGADAETTMSGVVWLNLNTSFTGKDSLFTQLAVGNGTSPANQFVSAGQFNYTGSPFFDQTSGSNVNQFVIRSLFYSFPVNDKLKLTVGPQLNWYIHFDNNAFTSPVNGAGSFNSINSTFLSATKRGAGAVVEWNISPRLELRAGYLAENIEFLPGTRPAANPQIGFFGGTNTITAELTFKPTDRSNIRFLYQRSHLEPNAAGQISYQPIFGVADDGFGGRLSDAKSDTFGVNFDWLLSKNFGIFGRYYYASTHLEPISNREGGDVNAQTIQAGLAFPDLGKQGAMGTLSFLIPFDVLDGRNFLVSGGGNGGTQFDIEASYYFPVTDNISVIPAVYVINNINNFDDNPTVFIGHIRSQFSF
ncbi:MAG TPA: iron uptake porin [Halomicronema sp.]